MICIVDILPSAQTVTQNYGSFSALSSAQANPDPSERKV
jgi:hypothetical protein